VANVESRPLPLPLSLEGLGMYHNHRNQTRRGSPTKLICWNDADLASRCAGFHIGQGNSMSTESLFRIAFWLIFGGMLAMQAYYACRARLSGRGVAAAPEAIEREGRRCALARAIRSVSLLASLLLYAVNPSWLPILSVPVPDWIRWIGIALGIVSLAIYVWSRETLGKEWSSELRMREQHHLVTAGPYARIRHPIYLALLVFLTSLALVAANWLFVALLLFSLADLAVRIPREEQMMIARFGDEYEAYMRRTGRLLPR
jgi:protein-S-isoprenylcysteine O-methyltransferase Ste14